MNITEAKLALQQGKRLRHTYFSKNEWIQGYGSIYLFEDGNICQPEMFWCGRTEGFDEGWSELAVDATAPLYFDLEVYNLVNDTAFNHQISKSFLIPALAFTDDLYHTFNTRYDKKIGSCTNMRKPACFHRESWHKRY